ncbi:ATP-binding protein [Ruminococcus sp. HUN007]|uniref:ATP-binding protein n=1 Tax=Ruminococcus sp. HUN007 TaxID=1514668 RepID=UPI000679BB05|nr:ATP-binding protein [Ruminococcus sp. HUN007]
MIKDYQGEGITRKQTMLIIQMLIVLFQFLMEVFSIVYNTFHKPDFILSFDYCMDYLVMPSLMNIFAMFSEIFFLTRTEKSERRDVYQKYIMLITFIVIGLVLYTTHYDCASAFAVFFVPIAMTLFYEDQRLTNITMLFSVGGLIPGLVQRAHDNKLSDDFYYEAVTSVGFVLLFGLLIGTASRAFVKRSESLREMTDIAENASRAKSDFLANMSHEIRTPMNAIVGMCELILREPDISDNVRSNCFAIQSSGRNLLYIINDILDFSKIESGKMELIESEFNIASTLNDVINMTVTRKRDKKIEIIAFVDPDIPSGLIGDEIRIRQIMINIMTNAVKYTNEGAVILRLSYTKHNYGINLKVTVEDTGIGISPENIEKLFTSFQQVDTRKNRAVEGTGLGLAISKRLVSKMGGFINVKSESGKGSVFSVVIPLRVSNERPFILIKDAEKINAVAFIRSDRLPDSIVSEKYNELVDEIRTKLKINVVQTDSIDEVKALFLVPDAGITHLFVTKEGYLENRQYIKDISNIVQVIIIQDIINSIQPEPNMKCIYKPLYSLSVASVFNNENIVLNLNERRNSQITFSAPKARVMIVDDNEINLKVAVGLMRPYNMQFITASSAKEAITLLRKKEVDLVLMDHMMPEMDGVEATTLIREFEDEYFKKLPIIALSANAVSGARKMFLEAGFNDFIPKPIEHSTLDRVLKKWLPAELICPPVRTVMVGGRRKSDREGGTAASGRLISVNLGLNYTGGNEEAYLDILKDFIERLPEKTAYINKLYEEEEWKDYVIETHALKSASLSIGSRTLSDAAKEMEMAGRACDFEKISTGHSIFLKYCNDVYDEGVKYLALKGIKVGEEIKPVKDNLKLAPPIKAEELLKILTKAADACAGFDADAASKLCEEASRYSFGGMNLKDVFGKAAKLANDYEYDQAGGIINDFIKGINSTGGES